MCGVVGIKAFSNKIPVAELSVQLLLRLQHRGQDGAGLTTLSEGTLHTVRGLGLIQTALKDWQEIPSGEAAVAHTRYATTGTGGVAEIQPFVRGMPKLALAHNGNIVNTTELKEKYNLKLPTASDLDVLQQVFLHRQAEAGFVEAIQTVFDEFNGSYAVVGLEEDGNLFAFRDPFGIRPLHMARSKDFVAFASETCALSALVGLDAQVTIEEIEPGEWVSFRNNEISRGRLNSRLNQKQEKRSCMFEVVYFASPQSETNGESIYRQRFRLGEKLADEILKSFSSYESLHETYDFVVPVPETSRAAALGVAEKLKLPYREYLVKNPYIPRTFILSTQADRLRALGNKLSLIGPEIRGQKILLVDDSVVRGNTSKMMALRLREAGAKSVGVASTCPPIRYGCYYGIDFPDPKELIAHSHTVEQTRKELGFDSLYYISEEALKDSLKTRSLCMACLNGEYPTRGKSFDVFLEQRRQERV